MKVQKRHIVLASLVVALGAAVYLNWQFSDTNLMLKTDYEDTKELGEAKYVNKAITSSKQDETTATDPTSQAEANLKKSQNDYFATAQTERQKTQDSILESIKEVTANLENSEENKKLAQENLEKIEKMILAQNNIEGVLKAKGFTECLCYLNDNSCTVIVLESDLDNLSTLIVKDAVQGQYNIESDKITIVQI